MYSQPESESSDSFTIALEIVPEYPLVTNLALVNAVGRDITDVLHTDGYTIKPVYSGQRGGFLIEVVIPFLNAFWTQKDIVFADVSELVTIFTPIILIARHLHDVHKRHVKKGAAQEPSIKITVEINGILISIEAPDLETTESALKLSQRFLSQHSATVISKTARHNTIKIVSVVPSGQSQKRR